MMTSTQQLDEFHDVVPQSRYDDGMPPRADPYASLRIRAEVTDLLRRLVRQISAEADRDITQSEAMAAAISYALDHLAEVSARLPEPTGDDR